MRSAPAPPAAIEAAAAAAAITAVIVDLRTDAMVQWWFGTAVDFNLQMSWACSSELLCVNLRFYFCIALKYA